ncbi:MAG: HNH endonuclease [Pararheinheimera sp.]|nr:HNH endonuclease [Rheinheimera sp.]
MPHKYTTEQLAFIKSHCTTLMDPLLCAAFNERFKLSLKPGQIKSTRKNHGFLTGRTGRFEKGNKPSPNARPTGPNKTSFKKGDKPHNWVPVGTERVNGDGYIDIKMAEPHVWVYKQRVLWEAKNGPIPEGCCILFKDGDNRNFADDNLMMVSRSELVVMNKMQLGQLPAELKESGLLLAKLKIATAAAVRKL